MKNQIPKIIVVLCFCLTFVSQGRAQDDSMSLRQEIISNALDEYEGKVAFNNQKTPYTPAEPLMEEKRNEPPPDYFYNKPLETEIVKKTEETSSVDWEFQLLGGFRSDNFDWNIAGDTTGHNPNILSELMWNNLDMLELKAKTDLTLMNFIAVDASIAYADVFSGENQDSDFLGDDRTFEFSRSNNSSDEGNAFDWSAGMGFIVPIQWMHKFMSPEHLSHFSLIPMAGYSYHELNLVMQDGNQTVPSLGPFPNLDSRYEASWEGPWLGFKLKGAYEKLSGLFKFEYHWLDYNATADWNLRTDFAHPESFKQTADAKGYFYNLNLGYHVTPSWKLNFDFDYKIMETDPGLDTVFLAAGGSIDTQLNEVNWSSYALSLGATYRFR